MTVPVRLALATMLLVLLVACGGGSGGDPADPTASASEPERGLIATPESEEEQQGGITDIMRQAADLEPVARYEPEGGRGARGHCHREHVGGARVTYSLSTRGRHRARGRGGARSRAARRRTIQKQAAGLLSRISRPGATPPLLQSFLMAGCWSPGGKAESGLVASAELYDPSSGTWTATGGHDRAAPVAHSDPPRRRQGIGRRRRDRRRGRSIRRGVRCFVRDMVRGRRNVHGAHRAYHGAVERWQGPRYWGRHIRGHDRYGPRTYDPSSGEWASAGVMSEPRISHAAVVLDDGSVLIAGGQALLLAPFLPLDSSEIYEPSSGQWSQAGTMVESRSLGRRRSP